MTDGGNPQQPGPLRYLAMILYDAMLLIAILFCATVPLLFITGGHAIRTGHPGYSLYLMTIAYIYFGWFWTRAGQTPGMRCWRVRIQGQNDALPDWRQAGYRFLCATVGLFAGGLGFLWAFIDSEQRTAHDRCSGTTLMLMAKPDAKKKQR